MEKEAERCSKRDDCDFRGKVEDIYGTSDHFCHKYGDRNPESNLGCPILLMEEMIKQWKQGFEIAREIRRDEYENFGYPAYNRID
jgi:hypothetical protein